MSDDEAGSAAERLALLVDRTARLHRLTAHLSTALHAAGVAEVVVDEGTTALGASTGALWRVDHAAHRLELLRARNYPDPALRVVESMPLQPGSVVTEAALGGEPIWISSRAEYEARYSAAAARTRAVAAPTYSIAALPLVLDGRVLGVLALTFEVERPFQEDERTYLTILALHCAQGFERARLYEVEIAARQAAEVAQERAAFLLRASQVLGSSLDTDETLRNVAALAVPTIADWCGIDLVRGDGPSTQVAVAHIDPAKVALAREIRLRYPHDPNATAGVPNVLRTGRSELHATVTDAMLVAGARDEEHLRISRELGLRSAMVVAIKDRGRLVGAITFVTTNDRRYGDADLLMAEQLADRAGAAIGNAALYDEARQAIRARDEFMLIAGHELRTPLASLTLLHEALINTREGTPTEKVRERGRKLKSQSERLSRLVEDLLDVSRISAGRLELDREELDLGALVTDCAERMREDFERARAPLDVQVAEVRGWWDKARVEQILTNLFGNAAKYGKGTPVEVRLERHPSGAKLVVTDQGIGIAVADQPRIFQRFERAVSARNFGGLGLGLWITTQLVEAHGGTINVESAPGAGATFTVVLPITSGN
ncbi:MAG: ATP-binding protein [Myxococcota bacterium]|nr:ATP-binding protein [Myxococcota bacterium]